MCLGSCVGGKTWPSCGSHDGHLVAALAHSARFASRPILASLLTWAFPGAAGSHPSLNLLPETCLYAGDGSPHVDGCIQRTSVMCQGFRVGAGRLWRVWKIFTRRLQYWQEAGCVFDKQLGRGTPVDVCPFWLPITCRASLFCGGSSSF